MPKPDLIIFDCDGVLVDSEIVAARVEAELVSAAGYEITAEEISEAYAGLTFKDMLIRIEEKAAIPFQVSLIDQAEDLIDRRLAAEVRAIEGVHEAAASVAGHKCICSNSRTGRIELMLEKTRLMPYFAGRIFSSLETPTGKPKPAPDVFLHAAATLDADPANTFVIEDSVHGIAGAKAAGMRDRLHRRHPQLSRPCRRADGGRRRNGDQALGGFPGGRRRPVGLARRILDEAPPAWRTSVLAHQTAAGRRRSGWALRKPRRSTGAPSAAPRRSRRRPGPCPFPGSAS